MYSIKNKNIKSYLSFILLFLAIVLFMELFFGNSCILKVIIGMPCPSCGMTRAWLSLLLKRNLRMAFYFHPLFFTVPIICILIFIEQFLNKKMNKYIYLCILILYIAVYIYRMYKMFPGVSPMDFNKNSIFMRIIRALAIANRKDF